MRPDRFRFRRGVPLALAGAIVLGFQAPPVLAAADDPALAPAAPPWVDWAEQGALHLAAGDHAAAEIALRRALLQAPQSSALHLALGLALGRQGQVQAALRAFQEAERLAPQAWAPPYHLGLAWVRQGQATQAIAAYQRALALAPSEARLWVNLGAAQLQAGQSQAALASLNKATQLAPESGLAWHNLGLAQARLGQLDAARASLSEAQNWPGAQAEAQALLAQLDPTPGPSSPSPSGLGLNSPSPPSLALSPAPLASLNPSPLLASSPPPRPLAQPSLWPQPPDALSQRVRLRFPPPLQAFGPTQAQALALWQRGRREAAKALVVAFAARFPDQSPAHAWLAKAYALEGQGPQALALAHKAIALSPALGEGQLVLAEVLLVQGAMGEAALALQSARRLGLPEESVGAVQAQAAYLQGDWVRAKALHRQHAPHSERPFWHALGALLAWHHSDWAWGRGEAQRFVKAAPWHPLAPWFLTQSQGPWRVNLPQAQANRQLQLDLGRPF